jgi:hypothetical protein
MMRRATHSPEVAVQVASHISTFLLRDTLLTQSRFLVQEIGPTAQQAAYMYQQLTFDPVAQGLSDAAQEAWRAGFAKQRQSDVPEGQEMD